MSECVVRMEMPKNCYLCDFRGSWAFCPIGKWPVVGYKKQRHEDCPIICQLPEGHGRLGDLDELGRKINGARIRVMQDGQDTNPYWECGDIIASEKTIVPADTAERSET